MITKITDAGADNIRIAIVELACHDYLKAKEYRRLDEIDSLTRFFRSQWYRELLPKVDGEYLMRKLDEKYEQEIKPTITDKGKSNLKRKSAK